MLKNNSKLVPLHVFESINQTLQKFNLGATIKETNINVLENKSSNEIFSMVHLWCRIHHATVYVVIPSTQLVPNSKKGDVLTLTQLLKYLHILNENIDSKNAGYHSYGLLQKLIHSLEHELIKKTLAYNEAKDV